MARRHRTLPRVSVGDVVAGVSVGLVVIPQSMAYAELAGLPPHVGLFAAALPPLLAAAFTSSPYLQTGPVALTSLLTFGALEGRAELESADYVALAALLALIVGATRLVLGLARFGAIAYLMSEAVVIGFTSAAAVLIMSSQLPTVFDASPTGDGVLARAWWAVTHPGSWRPSALLFAAVTLILMLGGRRIHALFPGVLVAVAVAAVVSDVADYGGATIGELPGGFVDIDLDLPWGSLADLALSGVLIALIGYAEPASIARTYATLENTSWDSSRELVGQGVANLAAAASGAFPVGGSFSRTALNRFAGATSSLSGAVTGALVLAFLPISPVLEPLPRAVLGAIVCGAVYQLVQPNAFLRLAARSRFELVSALVTFAATLLTSPRVERGVVIGVVASWVIGALGRRSALSS